MINIITLSNTEKHLLREYFTRVNVNGHSRRVFVIANVCVSLKQPLSVCLYMDTHSLKSRAKIWYLVIKFLIQITST